MRQHLELTQSVDSKQLISYPNKTWSHEWTAPTDIPVGSLKEATLRWAHVTGNLPWAEEPGCFHGNAPEHLLQHLRKYVHIPERFTDILRQEISNTENALNDDDCFKLYKHCLEQAYHAENKPLTPETIALLKKGFETGIPALSAST